MAESASFTLGLSPAEEERDNQGTHELELHYGGELDLHQHVVCDKNPGHADFIPANSVNIYKLNKLSEVDTLNLTLFFSEAAKMTTKIKVYRVSSNRSKEKMKKLYNIDHYPLSAYAGKKKLGVGSGCVTGIDVSGDRGPFLCPIKNCTHSWIGGHLFHYYISITTAAHVVFDDDEAKETIVEFFDDNPKNKKNVEIAYGVKVKHCSVEGDFCEFVCVTHSQSLFGKMSELCSLSIPFQPDYFVWQNEAVTVAVYILGLFEIIKMIFTDLNCILNLKALLGCDHDTSMMLQNLLSECRKLHLKGDNSDRPTSRLATVENFLNAAENVSGISGLKKSVLRVIYKNDASFHFRTNFDIETTVKRIALTGTVAIIKGMPLDDVIESFLNKEGIYILFSDVLNALGDTDWPLPSRWPTETISDRLMRMFSGVKQFDIKDQDTIFLAINQWFTCAHDVVLPAINDKLDTILKCQLITKLSPLVTKNYRQIKDNLLGVSDYLDQVARTLNIHFGYVYNSLSDRVSDMSGPNSTSEERCRHLTQLWITNAVIPSDDDIVRATLGVRQKICDLVIKCADVKKSTEDLSFLYQDIAAISAENQRKSIVDTEEIFDRVRKCLFESENVFNKEAERILHARRYRSMLPQHPDDTLLVHFSHPHGQSKQVSIGDYFSCNTGTGHYEHIYTVPTCMGCSGGPVWILPKGEDGKILWDQIYAVPHGGCYDRGNKLNHSSSWTFLPFSVGQEEDKVH